MGWYKEKIMEKVTSTAAKPVATTSMTRVLLACGVVAGPIYLVVGLIQAFTRPEFDITRHSLSLLSNGDLGWIHITNLVVSGLLVMAGAVGMRQALLDGRGKVWGPVLVGVYGLGLIGSGFFVADPAFGFPPGTPADANAVSGQGLMHFVSGGVGFLSLIAACLVFARRFASFGQRGWTVFSIVTGIVFLAGFAGIASGSGSGWSLAGFWIGLVLAWAWVSALSARLRGELAGTGG
jgi:hypothetical membrane protein